MYPPLGKGFAVPNAAETEILKKTKIAKTITYAAFKSSICGEII